MNGATRERGQPAAAELQTKAQAETRYDFSRLPLTKNTPHLIGRSGWSLGQKNSIHAPRSRCSGWYWRYAFGQAWHPNQRPAVEHSNDGAGEWAVADRLPVRFDGTWHPTSQLFDASLPGLVSQSWGSLPGCQRKKSSVPVPMEGSNTRRPIWFLGWRFSPHTLEGGSG